MRRRQRKQHVNRALPFAHKAGGGASCGGARRGGRGRSRVERGRAAAVGEGGRRKVRRRRTQPLWALAFQPALLAHVARGDFPCLCRPDPGGQSPSRGGRHEAGGWAQNGINAHRLCSTERDKMSQQHGELDQLADRPLSMREVPGSKPGFSILSFLFTP